MPAMRLAVFSQDSQTRQSLIAQLALLGEQVVPEHEPADAAFVVADPVSGWSSSSQADHLVLCSPNGADASRLAPQNAVAKLTLPASLTQLETALATLYRCINAENPGPGNPLPEVVGNSDVMAALREQCFKVARGHSTVLLTGPSGTGKSFLAEVIHQHSERARGPFVPINCGAIPAELVESELFGHEKGAFTGAFEQRVGRFERARGGTLFLDEIGDLPYPMQVKLLRAIQERAFERVGGVETLEADVRIVAATNADLEAAVASGEFREDLYYRLNVFPVSVPSLAERAEDLPALIEKFSAELAASYSGVVRLTGAAVARLAAYSWPGNLRELRNLLERLSVQHPDALIDEGDLPGRYRGQNRAADASNTGSVSTVEVQPVSGNGAATGLLPVNGIDLKAYLAELEQSLIEQALRDTDAVVARAADRLHIRRTTLVEKMRKYGIERRAP